MIHDIIFLILGLTLLVVGANFVTDGAVAIAHKFKVSNLMIGLTVVALGSSMPDIVVCVESAIEHKTALAVGEVIGANIFDILLAVGVMGIIHPWTVSTVMRKQDLPILFISCLALWIAGDTVLFDGAPHNVIDRSSGTMLLIIFIFYMWFMIVSTRKTAKLTAAPVAAQATSAPQAKIANPAIIANQATIANQAPTLSSIKAHSAHAGVASSHSLRAEIAMIERRYNALNTHQWFSWILILVGLGMLVIGGNWVVDGASGLALKVGMSQGLVALTVVAIGNSLPDIVTSVTATLKGANGIAFGNLVGACIINALLALGISAAVSPLTADTIGFVDYMTLVGSAALIWLVPLLTRKHRIGRLFGIVLCLLYAAYMTFTVIRG